MLVRRRKLLTSNVRAAALSHGAPLGPLPTTQSTHCGNFGGRRLALACKARRAKLSRKYTTTNPRVYPRERRIWSGDPGNSETLNTFSPCLEIESSRATSASRDREDSSGLKTKVLCDPSFRNYRNCGPAETIIDARDKVALLISARQKTETAPRHAVGAAAMGTTTRS